jgi:hypothetical protein
MPSSGILPMCARSSARRRLSEAERLRIGLMGGGLSGLTLAAQAGHEATVFERREQGMFGAGVTLWPDLSKRYGASSGAPAAAGPARPR